MVADCIGVDCMAIVAAGCIAVAGCIGVAAGEWVVVLVAAQPVPHALRYHKTGNCLLHQEHYFRRLYKKP